MTTNEFSKGDVLELLITMFILPTIDVWTGILIIEEVLTSEDPYIRQELSPVAYAMIAIGFLVLPFVMMIQHYLRTEKSWKEQFATILLLFLQVWPQYRAARLLWFAFVRVDNDKYREEKFLLESLSHVGK